MEQGEVMCDVHYVHGAFPQFQHVSSSHAYKNSRCSKAKLSIIGSPSLDLGILYVYKLHTFFLSVCPISLHAIIL